MCIKQYLALTIILSLIGVVWATPQIAVANPRNTTYFNISFPIDVSTNETGVNWTYSIDGATNTSFTPNISVLIGRGNHTIQIFVNDTATNHNVSTIQFNTSFLRVQVFDLETEVNISSGINTRILSPLEVVLASNTTNGSGENFYINISFTDDLKVQAGGPAGSAYPHIFTYSFDYTEPITNLRVLLPESTSCQFITYQYIDSFFSTPLSSVSVRFFKSVSILTEGVTDSNGFISVCLVPGLNYILESTLSGFVTANFTDRATIPSPFVQMVRDTFPTSPDSTIILRMFPLDTELFANDTLFMSMFIEDTDSQLAEYSIVYGRSPEILLNDDVDSDNPVFKQEVASGTQASGEYLRCTDTKTCLDVEEWGDTRIFVDYKYRRTGEATVHKIREFRVSRGLRPQNFYINYTFQHNPKHAIHRVFASFGYASDIPGEPSGAMITVSLFVMMISTASAARKGWGILGSMMALMASNIIMVILGLIQGWTIIVIGIMLAYTGKQFKGGFT